MESTIPHEKQFLAEIEELREQFPQTQDLYREVCVLLFFRYGITPTANKLYQLVRKGSMSAPAEALSKFWSDLRDKSRVRIEQPDLPEELKTAAGEFASTFWTTAKDQANKSLVVYRNNADEAVSEAKAALSVAASERDRALRALEKSQEEAANYIQKITELEQKLAVAAAANNFIQNDLQQARAENIEGQKRLDDTRREFGEQLDKLRDAAQQAEERFQAAEKRALLEIDRERQANAKLQRELEIARNQAEKIAIRHRSEIESLQQQIGNFRQQLGSLEGKLQEATDAKKEISEELKAASAKANELASGIVTIKAEMQGWRARAETAEHEIHTLIEKQNTQKPRRSAKAQMVEGK